MRRKQPILLMQQGNVSVAKTIVSYFEKKVCRYANISAKPNSQLNPFFFINWKYEHLFLDTDIFYDFVDKWAQL